MSATGLWVLAGTVLAGLLAGGLLALRNGRIRKARERTRPLPGPVAEALLSGGAVTLVQLSTTFCAPCRHARAVLEHVAARTEGLAHAELDVTDMPWVAQELGVLRTPTTLALDADGRELLRVAGVPKQAGLLAALEPHLPGARDDHPTG